MNVDIQPKDTSPGHFYISLVKSFVRIAGCVAILMAQVHPLVSAGAGLLLFAELLGILEELV